MPPSKAKVRQSAAQALRVSWRRNSDLTATAAEELARASVRKSRASQTNLSISVGEITTNELRPKEARLRPLDPSAISETVAQPA